MEKHVVCGAVVGVADATPAVAIDEFDVLLTTATNPPRPWVTADSIAALETTVHASPAAATTLVHVLRATETLPVEDALAVESIAYSMLQHGEVFETWLREHPRRPARAADVPPIRLERMAGTLEITLQRPDVHNALDAAMRDALCEAFSLVTADDTITDVHLRGDGPTFCSGGDLREFGQARDAGVAHLVRMSRSVGRLVHRNADRVTAHLHGACIGAGIEISAFAGTVIAAPDTTIRLPEVAMGLIPGAGGTVSLSRRIGRHRTAALALLGAPIDARTAKAWGLVDRIRSACEL